MSKKISCKCQGYGLQKLIFFFHTVSVFDSSKIINLYKYIFKKIVTLINGVGKNIA